ncbi:MAG: membrane protein insertase YidC [Cytophagales bacterium]|nr:MAG: membrane protein insertase YidC [Cytophagales bacterium]
MERNQITGIILITLLMLGYFMYVGNKTSEETIVNKDTTALNTTKPSLLQTKTKPINLDSSTINEYKSSYGQLAIATSGKEELITIENKNLKIDFSNKGGYVKKVLLKNYFTSSKTPLYLFDENNNHLELNAHINGKPSNLYELFYEPKIEKFKDSTTITFSLNLSSNQNITQTYTIPENGYGINYRISFNGLENIIENKSIEINWIQDVPGTENDNIQSRDRTTINYYTVDGSFNNLAEASKSTEEETLQALKWVVFKQKFFNSGFIAQNKIEKAIITATPSTDTLNVKMLQAKLNIPIQDFYTKQGGQFKLYFGPTQNDALKNVAEGYDKNLYLGYPVIREFNKYVVTPLFEFLQKFITNYGIIIIILGILVKLLLLPLSFKSQVSMAKMRVMKPELDELKTLYPDDMQKQQSEQMKLYQKVGINPLSGCVPVLLSMPVLLAMFSFFPNAIELRQQAFLWAPDLSTYDAPFHLPFTIPFYGSHVSIFTLLMTLSTLALTFFNNQMTTAQGPMKSVSYIMPVVFMFVLNSFPAGLSFYYLVSNILSIAQQKIMQQFVDEDKIKHQLEENRKKNASGQNTGSKSKWMQRVEDAMKAREEQLKNQKKK